MLKVLGVNLLILRFAYNTIQFYDPGSSLFSWHPTLMVIGQLLILNGAFLFKHLPYKWKVTIHGLLTGAGYICLSGGFWAIYQNKINMGKPHFASWHGTLGITLIISMGVQVAGGTLIKYGGSLLKENMKYARVAHRISGFLCILISFVEISLVTKESKVVYLLSVAVPSSLLIASNLRTSLKSLKVKPKVSVKDK